MPDRVFSILHLSLIERREPELAYFRGSREEWLRYVFSEPFRFQGWGGKEYHWLPKKSDAEFIIGLIQGTKPYSYHEAPELGGDERKDDFWQGAYVFIDPRHHDQGQKLGIENDVLGRPRALAKSLFDHINSRPDAPYTCEPELIFDESDFWRFARESGNVVRYIRFEFVVPNMWSPQNDLEEDLKDTGRETGSERVDVTFRGKKGVKTDSEKVRIGVAYAGRGAGKVKAQNFKGEKFSSDLRPTTVMVSEDSEGEVEVNPSDVAAKVLNNG